MNTQNFFTSQDYFEAKSYLCLSEGFRAFKCVISFTYLKLKLPSTVVFIMEKISFVKKKATRNSLLFSVD